MTSLLDLLEMVKAAEGPSRELDGVIWREIVGFDPDMLPKSIPDVGEIPSPFPPLTSSIDAALELVERELPGCIWTIEPDSAWVRVLGKDDVDAYQGFYIGRGGKCTALAILCALIKAKIEATNE